MKLVVGLGNPGKEYEKTRHNVGFMVLDKVAEKLKVYDFKEKFSGLLGEANYKGEKVLLLKPQTYMNLSGNSIVQVINFYKLNVEEDLIVVYDDMALPLGEHIEAGKKSVAISIVMRNKNGTLNEEDITKVQDKILNIIRTKYSGEIRQ